MIEELQLVFIIGNKNIIEKLVYIQIPKYIKIMVKLL